LKGKLSSGSKQTDRFRYSSTTRAKREETFSADFGMSKKTGAIITRKMQSTQKTEKVVSD
jgi:hypothetical protein